MKRGGCTWGVLVLTFVFHDVGSNFRLRFLPPVVVAQSEVLVLGGQLGPVEEAGDSWMAGPEFNTSWPYLDAWGGVGDLRHPLVETSNMVTSGQNDSSGTVVVEIATQRFSKTSPVGCAGGVTPTWSSVSENGNGTFFTTTYDDDDDDDDADDANADSRCGVCKDKAAGCDVTCSVVKGRRGWSPSCSSILLTINASESDAEQRVPRCLGQPWNEQRFSLDTHYPGVSSSASMVADLGVAVVVVVSIVVVLALCGGCGKKTTAEPPKENNPAGAELSMGATPSDIFGVSSVMESSVAEEKSGAESSAAEESSVAEEESSVAEPESVAAPEDGSATPSIPV